MQKRPGHDRVPARDASRKRVLLVDTLSGANDFGAALAICVAQSAALTVITVADTRMESCDSMCVLAVMPEYGGPRKGVQKAVAFARYFSVLGRELWRHRKDCVHVQFFRAPAIEFVVYLLARPWIRSLVYTAHNALPHERRWWDRFLYRAWYRLVDRIHVLGQHTAGELFRLGVRPDKVRVVPHGNYERFLKQHPPADRTATRLRFGIPHGAVVFLQYGLIREYKGVHRFVDAFCELQEGADAFLVLAGGGDAATFAEITTRLASAGRAGRSVCLRGFVPDQELSDLIDAADVLVFPYVRASQSGALLLGMTYGKACIASDLPAFREYVIHGIEAVLVNTSDRFEMARAMKALCVDAKLRKRLGENARARARSEYAWPRIAARLLELYS